MRGLLALSDEGHNASLAFSGRVTCCWEQITGVSEAGFHNSVLTWNYLRVRLDAPQALTNTITPVQIVAAGEGTLYAGQGERYAR